MNNYSEGTNSKTISKYNSVKVLKYVTFHGECSRKELARELGLTKMSISNIVNRIKMGGYLEEKESTQELRGAVGPKPNVLYVPTNKILAVGICIQESEITISLVDLIAGILYKEEIKRKVIDTNSKLVDVIKSTIERIYLDFSEISENIIGIGVVSEDVIDSEKGVIRYINTELTPSYIHIKTILEKKFNIPTYVESDIYAAAATDIFWGERLGQSNYLYIIISSRISAAYVSNYIVLKGISDRVTGLGHMSIKYDGETCACGNRGCYELYGSTAILVKNCGCSNIKEVREKLKKREPKSIRALDDFIHVTTTAFVNVVNLYDPECIVVNGDILELDTWVIKRIETLVNEQCLRPRSKIVKIVPSRLGRDAYSYSGSHILFYHMILKYI